MGGPEVEARVEVLVGSQETVLAAVDVGTVDIVLLVRPRMTPTLPGSRGPVSATDGSCSMKGPVPSPEVVPMTVVRTQSSGLPLTHSLRLRTGVSLDDLESHPGPWT